MPREDFVVKTSTRNVGVVKIIIDVKRRMILPIFLTVLVASQLFRVSSQSHLDTHQQIKSFSGNLASMSDTEADHAASEAPASSLYVGQAFETGTEALYAVQDHALSQGTSVRVAHSSGVDRRIVCLSSECGFYVQVNRRRHVDKSYGK